MSMKDLKKDFPILERKVNGKDIVYLDNAATTQKPNQVIEAISNYYKNNNANIHRSVHKLSEEATAAHEGARKKVGKFINANEREIIFTRGCTESINLVSHALRLKKGDSVVSTTMEHHSNIVPWQLLKDKGVDVKFVGINDDGTLKIDEFEKLIDDTTKLATVVHVSNVVGTVNNVKEIAKICHKKGCKILVDGAQAIPHMEINVKDIDADFYAFSGHKMLGPTGIGVLYGKKEVLERMEPFMGGGDMIKEVFLDHSEWNDVPWKFEAGTPNIAGAVGLGVAIDYLKDIGMKNIRKHDDDLMKYGTEVLGKIEGLKIIGSAPERIGAISFTLNDIHSHDIATIVNEDGIAIRSGHHCAQPLLNALGLEETARASFYFYNTKEDIDKLAESLEKVKKIFA